MNCRLCYRQSWQCRQCAWANTTNDRGQDTYDIKSNDSFCLILHNALWIKSNGKRAIGTLELCLSFYSHPYISSLSLFSITPNILDRFIKAKINIFWFSFSISLQNIRKKGTSWILSNISPKKRVHRYLQNTIFNFKLKFHFEDGLVEQSYFELFLGMVYIFILQKNVARQGCLHPFFTFYVILVKCSTPKSFFFCGKYET